MNMPLVLLNRRRRGFTAFSPSTLFSTTAIGVWYDPSDLTTMFVDRAGTTPVTTPGTVVGLRLDKSKGLALGSELVVNGDFASGTTGWTPQDANVVLFTSGGAGVATYSATSTFYQAVSVQAGKTYRATAIIKRDSGSGTPFMNFRSGTTLASGVLGESSPTGYTSASYVFASAWFVAASTGTVYLHFPCTAAASTVVSIDNISVRELPGNHATAPTDAARPIYGVEPKGGRRNLLTYSEQFNAASWLVFGGASKTGTDIAVAPDGTTTADSIRVTTAGTGSNVYQNQTYTVSAVPYTFSCWVKRNAASDQTFQLFNNLQGAQVSSGNLTATDTWQRFSLTSTSNAGSGVMLIGIIGNTSGAQADLLVWGAQLELGSTATPYQRVTTAYDVTESGVATTHYVQYDGSDDSMSTSAIDFTATDKMSVFAGVRKLSDAAYGCITELGSTGAAAGQFGIFVNQSSNGKYYLLAGGTGAFMDGTTDTATVAPASDVLTVQFDRPASTASSRLSARIDGLASAITFTNSGILVGNFGNLPLFIGRRNNASLPFNGRDYGLIVVGKAASAGEITDTETWLAARTAQVTL